MTKQKAVWTLLLVIVGFSQTAQSQDDSRQAQAGNQASTSPDSDAQNIGAYVQLLRSNVRQQKAEIMGTMMQLSAADAAKFWPIYDEYDLELTKLNNLRVANIQEYAHTYAQMTDQKADELIQKALSYRKQRSELLAKYYGRVKQQLGAVTAARFLQVEDQLLLIIDLQIDSSLPIVVKG
jgi:hypothetical protein